MQQHLSAAEPAPLQAEPYYQPSGDEVANYLPAVFGARQYALLHRPELLPGVLLDWIKRLVSA
ncbi:hypothetical protein [Pseudomonas sp. ANT_H12B]|uniref:hypothetical protein n=1 Tax=Pseudomonas sp. ANT_H12B TaxID=2597348 RepID=UPI0011EE1B8E|nr:hypothetical protein [Pseudomonas sp. ANT_H12B]KAA0955040.1 hypothetical protein FQ185_29035 [Pseudomonas sp. ANT_H12B]